PLAETFAISAALSASLIASCSESQTRQTSLQQKNINLHNVFNHFTQNNPAKLNVRFNRTETLATASCTIPSL
ncbi:MAG TPA: hypothetical protein VK536_05465, partial [Candidatus Limnocylindrales bacterium]|nr:hypothetical protein [Candidatus Limnocylindrales bacterium]